MTDKTYFIVKEPGMSPREMRPIGSEFEFAKKLIAQCPEGTAIIHVLICGDNLYAEDASTFVVMVEAMVAMNKEQEAIVDRNEQLLRQMVGTYTGAYVADIRRCLSEAEAPSSWAPLEIVDKPTGQSQDEDWGSFKHVFVDQYQDGGMEGDSFAGYIYIPLPDGKYLKAHYSC